MALTDEMGARYLAIGAQRFHMQCSPSQNNNVYWTTFRSGSQNANLEYTWPDAMATVNNSILTCDPGGTLSWDTTLTGNYTFAGSMTVTDLYVSSDIHVGGSVLTDWDVIDTLQVGGTLTAQGSMLTADVDISSTFTWSGGTATASTVTQGEFYIPWTVGGSVFNVLCVK
jgi:hypothetical protein